MAAESAKWVLIKCPKAALISHISSILPVHHAAIFFHEIYDDSFILLHAMWVHSHILREAEA